MSSRATVVADGEALLISGIQGISDQRNKVEGVKMLEGKKTYISAALLALMTLARSMDWLDQQQFDMMLGLLGSMGLAALRAGVSKH